MASSMRCKSTESIGIYVAHTGGLSSPVFWIILNNTERVNPKVSYFHELAYVDSVFEGFREIIKADALMMLRDIALRGYKMTTRPPTMT
jgi:hypothetical protein